MHRLLLPLALLSLSCHAGNSHHKPKSAHSLTSSLAAIRAKDMKAHVEVLASNEFAGRETLQPGYEQAATYIAKEFESYGLFPMPGQQSMVVLYDLWQQGYDLDHTSLQLTSNASSQTPLLGQDAAPFGFSDEGSLDAPIVFAGYGITATELNYDDYQGLDVKDKWVLVLRHAPGYRDEKSAFFGGEQKRDQPPAKGTPDPRRYATFTSKALNAQDHGAKGMLLVSGPLTANMPDDLRVPSSLRVPLSEQELAQAAKRLQAIKKRRTEAAKSSGKEQPEQKRLLAFHISQVLGTTLLASTGHSLEQVQAQVDAGVLPSEFKLRASAKASVAILAKPKVVQAKNIVAFLPGSDPVLKEQYVVIGGHYDHLGAFAGQAVNDQDTVFNGADDNASGTSGVLELAQAFALAPIAPKRSMVFVAFSGEEKGLLGSRALAKEGDIDTSKVAFMLNLDMIGRNRDKAVEFVGGDYATDIQKLAEKANEVLALDLTFGEYAANSDHHSFFQKEVPVAFFFTGLHEDYHGLSDHADKLDYERMERIVKLGFALTHAVADAERAPIFIHKLNWLGASIQRLSTQQGKVAQVTAVQQNSRANDAGLLQGDIITSIGGANIAEGLSTASETLGQSAGRLLRDTEPGTTLHLTLLRQGKAAELSLQRAKRGYLGIYSGLISDEERQKFGLNKEEGLRVGQALPNTPASKSGLRDGDIITKLAGQSVSSATLGKLLSRIGAGESIQVQVIRDGKRLEMPLTLGERPTR